MSPSAAEPQSPSRADPLTLLGRFYIGLMFVFLLLPITTLIVFSFQKNQYASIPGLGWTLKWYERLFADDALMAAVKNSLFISPVAATVASVLGFLAAYAIHRYQFPGRRMLIALIMLPMLIPALILGIAFLGLLSRFGLEGQWYSVVIAHVVLVTAPAMAIIELRLAQMPSSLEEAARNLGATEWQTMTRVVLPYALSGIAGGWLLAFTFSFDEFIIAWFVCGFTPTLPVSIYAYIVGSADPSLNAMAAIIFAVSCFVLLAVELLLIPMLVKGRPARGAGMAEQRA